MMTTPEICFEAILHISSKSESYTNVIQGHCMALLCRRIFSRRFCTLWVLLLSQGGWVRHTSYPYLAVLFSKEDLLLMKKTLQLGFAGSLHLVERLQWDHTSQNPFWQFVLKHFSPIMPDYALQQDAISTSSSRMTEVWLKPTAVRSFSIKEKHLCQRACKAHHLKDAMFVVGSA